MPHTSLQNDKEPNPTRSAASAYLLNCSLSEYNHEWPLLKPGGLSEDDSSDILTDDFSSDLSSNSLPPKIVQSPSGNHLGVREFQSGYVSDPMVSRNSRTVHTYPKETLCSTASNTHPVYKPRKTTHCLQLTSAVDNNNS